MAQILVVTDAPEGAGETIHSEHVEAVHLESDHSGAQLLERVRWALRDAQVAERRARLRLVSRRRGGQSRAGASGVA